MRRVCSRAADSLLHCQTEIQNLHLPARRDKNIRRLDIPMNDPLGMRRLQRVGNLDRHSQQFLYLERLSPHHLRQRLPFKQLHHDKMLPLVLFDRMDGANVGMIQRGCRPRLPLKSLQQLRILRHFRRKKFQRHAPSELSILGFVHHAHAATAQLTRDFVVGNALTK